MKNFWEALLPNFSIHNFKDSLTLDLLKSNLNIKTFFNKALLNWHPRKPTLNLQPKCKNGFRKFSDLIFLHLFLLIRQIKNSKNMKEILKKCTNLTKDLQGCPTNNKDHLMWKILKALSTMTPLLMYFHFLRFILFLSKLNNLKMKKLLQFLKSSPKKNSKLMSTMTTFYLEPPPLKELMIALIEY
jgi:hypothetical protein